MHTPVVYQELIARVIVLARGLEQGRRWTVAGIYNLNLIMCVDVRRLDLQVAQCTYVFHIIYGRNISDHSIVKNKNYALSPNCDLIIGIIAFYRPNS